MSYATECAPCWRGDHDNHEPRLWLIGGTNCACVGDCTDRSAQAWINLGAALTDPSPADTGKQR